MKKERRGISKVAVRMNLEVSLGEAWFPELERVWSQERMRTFPREHRSLWGPTAHWANTTWLGPRALYCPGGRDHRPRECATPATEGNSEASLYLPSPTSTPFPSRTWGLPWTQKLENRGAKPLPSLLHPLLPSQDA